MKNRAAARGVWGRLAVVLLLLVAQQSAFNHKIWHLGGSVAYLTERAAALEVPGGNAPAQETLCPLHTALGAVVGVIAGHALPVKVTVVEEVHVPFPGRSVGVRHAVRPVSRGPPLFL